MPDLRQMLKLCLLLALAVPMAAVPVRIRLDLEVDRTLEGGESCTVNAQHPDGQPRTWRWPRQRPLHRAHAGGG